MEQEKLSFQTILLECITNPEGEIANMQLAKENQETLNEAIKFVNSIEENANDLRKYHLEHPEISSEEGAKAWAKDKYEQIKKSRKN